MNNLKLLRKKKNLSQEELGKLVGVTKMTISRWEKGGSDIDINNLKKLSQYFGVSIDYILGNESGQQDVWREVKEVPQLEVTEDVTAIPLVASLRCGYDYAGQPYNVIKAFPIPKQWIKKWGSNIVANRAEGNSMSPTIRSGDIMICVPGEAWSDGNIVIIDINDSDTIKRIYRSSDGGIDLIPDNKSYKAVHYTPEELETYQAHVLGRVAKVIGPDLI